MFPWPKGSRERRSWEAANFVICDIAALVSPSLKHCMYAGFHPISFAFIFTWQENNMAGQDFHCGWLLRKEEHANEALLNASVVIYVQSLYETFPPFPKGPAGTSGVRNWVWSCKAPSVCHVRALFSSFVLNCRAVCCSSDIAIQYNSAQLEIPIQKHI